MQPVSSSPRKMEIARTEQSKDNKRARVPGLRRRLDLAQADRLQLQSDPAAAVYCSGYNPACQSTFTSSTNARPLTLAALGTHFS